MKILTGEVMKKLDEYVIKNIGLSSLVLMENAGRSVAEILTQKIPELKKKKMIVVAGRGNNGGDGLAAARHLINWGANIEIFILAASKEELSPEAATNAAILEKSGANVKYIEQEVEVLSAALARADIVIDAIFGIGIKGAVRGVAQKAIELINRSSASIVSVDLPSGLDADTGHVEGVCVKADLTITLEFFKLGLLLYPGREYAGEIIIAQIGYPKSIKEAFKSELELVDREFVTKKIPKRRAYSHKGDYGRVFLIAGSRGMTGAAALAAEAALRSGAGLVYAGIPQSLSAVIESKLTEAVKIPLPDSEGALAYEALAPILQLLKDKDVLAIGPGLSKKDQTAKLVKALIKKVPPTLPIVIDADAINILSEEPRLLKALKSSTVLTPHPGELSRLIKKKIEEIEADRVGVAKKVAADFNVVLVLKGVPTVTALPSGFVFINSTGNSGLASGGSGDVLTGLIAGLIAQGLRPEDAAPTGAYLHGLIADRLKEKTGERAMIAGDLIKEMPAVLKEFER